jgi:uridine monophosphate synthetase
MLGSSLSYEKRIAHCKMPLAKKILQIISYKKSNLCLSADITRADTLLQLAKKVAPHICMLKTHIDILDDYTPEVSQQLRRIADEHEFILFEDRKFADIGNTVKQQYAGGIFKIAEWADLVNAHSLPGPGVIAGLAEVSVAKGRGILLLAQMSSDGNLVDEAYEKATLKMAEQYTDAVLGFICQHALSAEPQWLYLTPGISLAAKKDSLGQTYGSPESAILERGCDIIIVGRGIITAADPKLEASRYQQAGWDAYLKRLANNF